MDEIIPYYKPLGLTPLEAIEQLRAERPELKDTPITYAGRLDPMAEGLLLLLIGEAVHKKDRFLNLDKTYEAKILLGFSSDTYDILGLSETEDSLFKRVNEQHKNPQDIVSAVNSLIGSHEFEYPNYSSKPVNGKPLWMHAREGTLHAEKIPQRMMTVISADVSEIHSTVWSEIYSSIKSSVGKVNGDFRQNEIQAQWDELNKLINSNHKFQIVNITFRVSSGTYIRTLANELGKLLQTKTLLFHLKRTEVGDFKLV